MSVTLKDLEGLDVIGYEPDLPTQKAIDAMCEDAGVRIERSMHFDNVDTVKKAVELGPGVAIVPMRAVSAEVESGRLVALMLNEPNCWRPLGILGKRNRAVTPAMREFIRVLTHSREVVGAIPQPIPPRPLK